MVNTPEEIQKRHDFWHQKVMDSLDIPGLINTQALERCKPHKAVQILMMLEECASVNEIVRQVGTNHNVIYRIRARHSASMADRRKEFSRRFATLAEMSSDLLAKKLMRLDDDDEKLDGTPLKDIALTMAIVTDKAAQADGMPSVVIEHRRGASIEDAAKRIAEARARIADKARGEAVEAEIIPQ